MSAQDSSLTLAHSLADALKTWGIEYDTAIVLVKTLPDGRVDAAATGDSLQIVRMLIAALETYGFKVQSSEREN